MRREYPGSVSFPTADEIVARHNGVSHWASPKKGWIRESESPDFAKILANLPEKGPNLG